SADMENFLDIAQMHERGMRHSMPDTPTRQPGSKWGDFSFRPMRCGARIAQRSRSSASSTTRKGMLRKPSARRRAESAMPTTFARQPSHYNDDWGLVRHFATRDVRELKT